MAVHRQPGAPEPVLHVTQQLGGFPIEAKLSVASLTAGIVPRDVLVDHLVEHAGVPVVLVQGPPGYGKTTVVQQWQSRDERPFAWLVADAADNDPVVLLSYVLLALLRLEPVDPVVLASIDTGDAAGLETSVRRLRATMERRRQPFVLVIDRAESIESSASVEVLSTLIGYLPVHSQLVVIAQQPPPLDWSALRVQRRLTEIDRRALRMSDAEGAALLAAGGVQLDDDEVETLVRRTEGWPAGLYLAALSLSAGSEQRRSVAAFRGSEKVVATYLREHVLAGLPQQDQTFLTRLAFLNRMSGPLCDYVLESNGSGETLRRLADANALLFPLDREHTWFRLHPLFREALRAESSRREAQFIKHRSARASRWLERAGFAAEAIEMGYAAGQTTRTARLIWTEAGELIAAGDVAPLERWLETFSVREITAHAALALTAAWCALLRGRPADHWVSAAERGRYEGDREGEPEAIAAAVALLHGVLAHNGVVQMAGDARVALRLQEPDDIWRCTALLLEAASISMAQNTAEAERRLREVLALARALDAHLPTVGALTQLATIAIESNHWGAAEQLMSECFDLMRDRRLVELASEVLPHCAMAVVAAHRGDDTSARLRLRRGVDLMATTSSIPVWAGMQGRYLLARAQLILGDNAAARALLSEAMSLGTQVADATLLREQVAKCWRQTNEIPISYDRAASTLTGAELRVLQYLPTHLSFEQIAAELYVSRNTVKSQSIAVYRKLAVTSRAEAVQRAQALGIL